MSHHCRGGAKGEEGGEEEGLLKKSQGRKGIQQEGRGGATLHLRFDQ